MEKESRLGIGIIRRGKENYIQMLYNRVKYEHATSPYIKSIDKVVDYDKDNGVVTVIFSLYSGKTVEDYITFGDELYSYGFTDKRVSKIVRDIQDVYILPTIRGKEYGTWH